MNFIVKLTLATALVVLLGCKKRDPNPESKDPVYAEILKDLAQAKSDQDIISAQLETQRSDLSGAIPQSGEKTVYEKRLNDSANSLVYAKQRVRMYEVRLEERKVYVQRRYLESLTASGRKWPEDGEAESELLKLKLLREKSARLRDSLDKEATDVPRGTTQTQNNK